MRWFYKQFGEICETLADLGKDLSGAKCRRPINNHQQQIPLTCVVGSSIYDSDRHPLSPILIDREVRAKRFNTYQTNGATSISHQMYADDNLLFSKANPQSLRSIQNILSEFTLFSGLKRNIQKSLATFSKVCEEDQKLHDIVGFAPKKLPNFHLGLQIISKKKSYNQCWKLIQPIENLLSR